MTTESILTRTARRCLNCVLPEYVTAQVIFELGVRKSVWRAKNERNRFKHQTGLLVNVGSGGSGKDGWVNIDAFHQPGVNCVWDSRFGLPFADNSVKGIFTEHFLEHLDYAIEVPRFLGDCNRVLRPGGVIRIVVPDAEKYLAGYFDPGWSELTRVRPLREDRTDAYSSSHRYESKLELINHVFRQDYQHKYAYDFDTLALQLRRAGFAQVLKQKYNQSVMSELMIDLDMRASESLYVDAVKEEIP